MSFHKSLANRMTEHVPDSSVSQRVVGVLSEWLNYVSSLASPLHELWLTKLLVV
jgi:hypothetical protein